MKCLSVCHSELVIRTLEQVLPPQFDVEFLVDSRPLARRLHEAGVAITAGDLRKTDTFLKADLSPHTCVIVEDNGRRSLNRVLQAITDAGAAATRPTAKSSFEAGSRNSDSCRSPNWSARRWSPRSAAR
jgi:hypothetical protein